LFELKSRLITGCHDFNQPLSYDVNTARLAIANAVPDAIIKPAISKLPIVL